MDEETRRRSEDSESRFAIPPMPNYRPNVPPVSGLRGWWQRSSVGTKTLVLGTFSGVLIAALSAPLAPFLAEVGDRANPLEDKSSEPSIVVIGPSTAATQGWIVPREAAGELPRPIPNFKTSNTLAQQRAWESKVGAIQAQSHSIQLRVQGGSSKAVTLHGLTVDADCRESQAGVHVLTLGAGGLPSHMIDVELDAPYGPRVKPLGESGVENPNPEPATFPYFVTESELESFVITARAGKKMCDWTAELEWSIDERMGTTKIDDRGHAFRLTSPTSATSRMVLDPAGPP